MVVRQAVIVYSIGGSSDYLGVSNSSLLLFIFVAVLPPVDYYSCQHAGAETYDEGHDYIVHFITSVLLGFGSDKLIIT